MGSLGSPRVAAVPALPLASGTPVTKSGKVESTSELSISPSKQKRSPSNKTVTIISQGWGQGQSALQTLLALGPACPECRPQSRAGALRAGLASRWGGLGRWSLASPGLTLWVSPLKYWLNRSLHTRTQERELGVRREASEPCWGTHTLRTTPHQLSPSRSDKSTPAHTGVFCSFCFGLQL